ncbi:MAG: phosphotriesterase-related protein [Thermoanaerobacterium sp.]|jgi:phosphotriesterase-related protein|nr:phosphotriesterase-related protein [Thermoanaerobacterium sp.]
MEGRYNLKKKIQTVTGEILCDKIKGTMVHEHIVMDLSHVRGENTSILGDQETLPGIVEELKILKELGVNTIVELTNIGMRRGPKLLKKLSEENEFYIIVGTGYYKEGYYPPEIDELSIEELEEKLTKEVLDGIENTCIKAGIYGEIGSSYNLMTAREEKVFRAVAKSHKVTGAPISTHCELGTMGLEQRKIFDKEGIPPEKVSFGHQDLNENIHEQIELLKWGAFIQFDTIGKTRYRSDEARMLNLLELIDRGFENQIMLSCDISRKTYLKKFGGHGYVYLYSSFLKGLKDQGVSDDIIEKLTIKNPCRFLSFREEE